MRYPVTKDDGRSIGFYELNPFPGCNQLVVSNHAFIQEEFRGKGYGTAAHAKRLAEIRRLGYDAVICTVRSDNVGQIKILDWFGWRQVFEFTSRETGHKVCVYMFEISSIA